MNCCTHISQLLSLHFTLIHLYYPHWPPLWSSGQCSRLHIQRSGFDSQLYQIFLEVVRVEQGPLSLLSTIEELSKKKSSGSCLENREYGRRGTTALTTRHPSIRKSWHYADKRRSIVRYSSFADSSHGIIIIIIIYLYYYIVFTYFFLLFSFSCLC
jgi:hypothetical protein